MPFLDEVLIVSANGEARLFEGRKWISGRFDGNIGIDRPAYGAGDTHGHVYGRYRDQLVVVNLDGTGSHGTRGRLHNKDADALRAQGFAIHPSKLVEWSVSTNQAQLIAD